MTRTRTAVVQAAIGSTLALLCVAGTARAQNALGDGRALDRNLQQGSGGLLPGGVRRDPVQEQIRLNNAVVNGTATGGRAFRGSLGYTPAGQFSANLPSDSLYTFNRDAAGSGLTGLGVRGSDALRYQFGLTTGESAPAFLAQSGLGPGGVLQRPSNPTTSSGTALRSTSEFIAARATGPALVGVRQDEYGAEYTAKASPLLGISWVRTRESPLGVNQTQTNPAVPLTGLEPSARGMEGVLDKSAITGLTPNRPEDTTKPRPESMVYTRLMDELRSNATPQADTQAPTKVDTTQPNQPVQRPTDAPGTVKDASRTPITVDEQLEFLRAQLKGQEWKRQPKVDPERPTDSDRPADPSRPIEATPNRDPNRPENTLTPYPDTADQPSGVQQRTPAGQLPAPLIDGLRRTARKTTDSLVDRAADVPKVIVPDPTGPVDQALYQRTMEEGQELIARSRFFDAEDRFTRAIASAPGDAMARVGRIHAQLGAGLFLSAATNFRTLVRDHPEVVALRYSSRLLPMEERSKVIAEQLRSEVANGGSALQRDASLLLAYLGHQTGDQAMVTEGLDALAARSDLANTPEQTLLQLLRGAWGR